MFFDETKRTVVTGMGVVSAIGLNKASFWNGLVNGQNGISDVESFDTSGFESCRGGEIKDFDIEDFYPDDPIQQQGRAKQMATVALDECLKDAGYDLIQNPFRVGITVGTTIGEAKALEAITDAIDRDGMKGIKQEDVLDYPPYTIPQYLAGRFKIYGPNLMLPNACAAGNFSLDHAVHAIQSGRVDAVFAGGVDAFSRVAYSGFSRLGAISPDLPRPFSADRQGMIPGEGAAMLLVESYRSAVARGAHIYAEILGFGESCDAHHITQPNCSGVSQAMISAMSEAGVTADDISFVSVHGTGTPTNDVTETKALARALGENYRQVPVTSVKSMIGHPMGAASSIECVLCMLAIQNQYIPPTINFREPDPDCDVDCVPNVGRAAEITHVMKSSSAFGGNNSCIIFKAMA